MNTHHYQGVRLGAIPLAVALSLLLAAGSGAEEPAKTSPDIQKLLERLEKLEQRNEELEKTVRELKTQEAEKPVSAAGPETDRGDGTDTGTLDDKAIRKIVADYLEQNPPKAPAADSKPGAAEAKSCDGRPPTRYQVGKNLLFTASWKDGVWFETADKAFN